MQRLYARDRWRCLYGANPWLVWAQSASVAIRNRRDAALIRAQRLQTPAASSDWATWACAADLSAISSMSYATASVWERWARAKTCGLHSRRRRSCNVAQTQ